MVPNLVFHARANVTLGLGLAPIERESCLLISYLPVGFAVWLALGPHGSQSPPAAG